MKQRPGADDTRRRLSTGALAVLLALAAATAPAPAATINTGTECVTALHEDTQTAEPLPSRLPLTETVQRVFTERAYRLPEPARWALLVVAARDDTAATWP